MQGEGRKERWSEGLRRGGVRGKGGAREREKGAGDQPGDNGVVERRRDIGAKRKGRAKKRQTSARGGPRGMREAEKVPGNLSLPRR